MIYGDNEYEAILAAKDAEIERLKDRLEAFMGIPCGVCSGTGLMDSGGIYPWEEAVMVSCGRCENNPRVPANWFEDSSLEKWFPLTAIEIASLKAQLAALSWKPITPDSLPKVGDEIWSHYGEVHATQRGLSSDAQSDALRFHRGFWTHYRPINPPQAATEGQ